MRPTLYVQPVSAMTSGTNSLARAFTASAAACRRRARSCRLGLGPLGKRGLRGCSRGAGLVGRRLGRVGDDLLGRGVHDRVGAVAAGDPLAPDQQPVGVLAGQGGSHVAPSGPAVGAGSGPRLKTRTGSHSGATARWAWPVRGPEWRRWTSDEWASGPQASTCSRSRRSPSIAAEIEALGYGALWLPEVAGRDPVRARRRCCSAAPSGSCVATGIATIYGARPDRDGVRLEDRHRRVPRPLPARARRQPPARGRRAPQPRRTVPPLTAMREYLDGDGRGAVLRAAAGGGAAARASPRSGRRCWQLAADARDRRAPVLRAGRAHRDRPRDDGRRRVAACRSRWWCSRPTPTTAREIARQTMAIYLGLPELREQPAPARMGRRRPRRTAAATASSTRSSSGATRPRSAPGVDEHFAAGADHVCVQVLTGDLTELPMDQWRRLAPALLG